MKNLNKGFTMSEILITLGIIGIVSAIALPAINSLMPDKNKIMYLKAYDSLASTVRDLAYNTTLFPPSMEFSNGTVADLSRFPLANYTDVESPEIDVTISDSTNATNNKLCKVLAATFNTLGDEACMSDINFPDDSPSFITQNGMQWWVKTPMSRVYSASENLPLSYAVAADPRCATNRCIVQQVEYYSLVYVDIDPSNNSSNCIVTDEACENKVPDRFCFAVFAGGDVRPADSYGIEYLKNRMSTRYKKINIEDPKVAVVSQDDIHVFSATVLDEERDDNGN